MENEQTDGPAEDCFEELPEETIYIDDVLKAGDWVSDMYYGLPTKLHSGIEVVCTNHTVLRIQEGSGYPAQDMVTIALKGLVDHPYNKIAYVSGFSCGKAICVYCYDGHKYGQFELRLKEEG